MKKEKITICPHCGNRTPQDILANITNNEPLFANDGEYVGSYENYYYLTKCKTCNDISLFADWEINEAAGNLDQAGILYPSNKKFYGDLPSALEHSYNEAKKVEKVSPTAFAILIRRALEFLCKDKKATGRNLKNKIEDLGKKGIIPKTLAEMADALRFLGNVGAHASDYKIDNSEVKSIDEFFIAMLEFVYIAPAKIENLKKRIQEKKNSS